MIADVLDPEVRVPITAGPVPPLFTKTLRGGYEFDPTFVLDAMNHAYNEPRRDAYVPPSTAELDKFKSDYDKLYKDSNGTEQVPLDDLVKHPFLRKLKFWRRK